VPSTDGRRSGPLRIRRLFAPRCPPFPRRGPAPLHQLGTAKARAWAAKVEGAAAVEGPEPGAGTPRLAAAIPCGEEPRIARPAHATRCRMIGFRGGRPPVRTAGAAPNARRTRRRAARWRERLRAAPDAAPGREQVGGALRSGRLSPGRVSVIMPSDRPRAAGNRHDLDDLAHRERSIRVQVEAPSPSGFRALLESFFSRSAGGSRCCEEQAPVAVMVRTSFSSWCSICWCHARDLHFTAPDQWSGDSEMLGATQQMEHQEREAGLTITRDRRLFCGNTEIPPPIWRKALAATRGSRRRRSSTCTRIDRFPMGRSSRSGGCPPRRGRIASA